MNWDAIKVFSVVLVILLIVNLILFAMRIGDNLFFWAFIILAAVYAFLVLPKLKKKI